MTTLISLTKGSFEKAFRPSILSSILKSELECFVLIWSKFYVVSKQNIPVQYWAQYWSMWEPAFKLVGLKRSQNSFCLATSLHLNLDFSKSPDLKKEIPQKLSLVNYFLYNTNLTLWVLRGNTNNKHICKLFHVNVKTLCLVCLIPVLQVRAVLLK